MDQKLNRRDFLKRSAGTGAAALIVGGGFAWPRNGTAFPIRRSRNFRMSPSSRARIT